MALSDPQNTLAYHGSRVLCTNRDMSAVPVSKVTAAMSHFMKNDVAKHTVPESEALWFYGMNHGIALISAKFAPLEPLPKWENDFLAAYHQQMTAKAVRAFYYLIWICTREARHNQSLTKHLPTIKEKFGEPMFDFLSSISGGEAGISAKLLKSPPNMTIGDYCKALAWQFYKCKWSGGYGGPAWGAVTDCLVSFVTGEFTAEVMLDTVWTLCHNNGPIFNKGEFYKCYTSDPTVKRILDIQRSGQIPEGVLHDPTCAGFADSTLKAHMKAITERFPGEIGGWVDWHKVEALGSVNKYPLDKKNQEETYGLTPEQQAAIEAAKAKAEAVLKAKLEAEAKKKAEHAKNWFEVMPGVEVPKVKIKRAA